MKGQGGGGTARGGGKSRSGGGSVTIKKTKARKCQELEGNIITLREALFEANGKDKDVTKTIAPAFLKFDRSELNLSIHFETRLNDDALDWAFELVRSNMEAIYDESGYGWDDDDKLRELSEEGARFLLVKNADNSLVGFVHFRFTVQGEVMDIMSGEPCLFVWDIHVESSFRGKGIGKHLMTIIELIARQQKMKYVSLPICIGDTRALLWISKVKGFAADDSLKDLVGFDADLEGFEVFSKCLLKKPAASASSASSASTSIATAVPPPLPVPNLAESASSASNAVDTPSLPESSVSDGHHEDMSISVDEAVTKLSQLFIEKNGREPTAEEKESWIRTLNESADSSTSESNSDLVQTPASTNSEDDYVVVDHSDTTD